MSYLLLLLALIPIGIGIYTARATARNSRANQQYYKINQYMFAIMSEKDPLLTKQRFVTYLYEELDYSLLSQTTCGVYTALREVYLEECLSRIEDSEILERLQGYKSGSKDFTS